MNVTTWSRSIKSMMFFFAVSIIASTSSNAQSSWTNAAGGNWSTTANWVPGVLPGPGTNVFFTNSTPVFYTVTNNILNNTFGNLTVYRPGLVATVFSATDGFNPNGNAFIGNGGSLFITNSTATIGGSMTISNGGRLMVFDGAKMVVNGSLDNTYGVWIQGTNTSLSLLGGGINRAVSGYPYLFTAPTDLQFFNNGTLNIGGTNAATANASAITFTNVGSLTVNGFINGIGGSPSGATSATINASINQVGFYNNGKIENYLSQVNGGLNMNAMFVNGTNGSILIGSGGAKFVFERFPLNQGFVEMWNYSDGITVNNGDFVNQGYLRMENSTFTVRNGSFINETNGLVGQTSLYGATVQAKSMLNRGTIALTNGYIGPFTITGVLTNEGLLSLYRYDYGAFRNNFLGITASNIINSGTIRVLSQTNIFPNTQKNVAVSYIASPVTNLASGVITTTNGALMGFGTYIPRNLGTFRLEADSAIGIGYSAAGGVYNDVFFFGLSGYRNEGTIDLRGGAFGAAYLTNAAGATVTGYGDIASIVVSNLVSGTLLTTNLVHHFTARPIANQGTINAGGVLNAGAITNLSGGLITGSGAIVAYNLTNYYVGETLITDKVYTGARILNNAGASILASGGTLVLSNGLVNNVNAGTMGAINNGTLQLGDGTMALTNSGLIAITNGDINVGELRNNGTIQVVNSQVSFSHKLVTPGRYISDPSTNTFNDDVTVTPSGTLEGGIGDTFDFKKNLFINSTNTMQFNLWISTVSFSGGGNHTNSITVLDFGWDQPYSEAHGYRSTNYAYGVLRLGPTDNLFLTDGDGNGANSNALYIGILDIGSTNDLTLLHTPFNIYYRNGLVGNAYLGGLTYSLDGGGFLIPVPEPSSLLLLLTAGAVLLRRRVR